MKEEIKRNLLVVNSRDRKSGTSSDFIYSLGDNSLEIEAVSLKSAAIPHTYTNINSTNNLVNYKTGTDFVLASKYEGCLVINSIVYSYIITGGRFTQEEFLETLNSTLEGVLIVSYNEVASRYEVTTQQTLDVPFVLTDYQYYPAFLNLWTALGFVVPTTLASTPAVTLQAPNPPSSPFNVVPVQSFSVAIPDGQYNITDLIAEVAIAVSANVSGSISTAINGDGYVVINGATQTWKFNECDIAHYLGYDYKTMPYAVSPNQAQHKPDLLGYRYLYVASNTLMNGYNCIQKKGDKTSIVTAIPVCSTYQGIDKYESPYPVIKAYDGSVNISELDIQILNENNDPVPLDNADVVLVFEIWATVRL